MSHIMSKLAFKDNLLRNKIFQLLQWQQKFVDCFSVCDEQRSVLIAAAGTGKTITSIEAMAERVRVRQSGKVFVVSHCQYLRDQWACVAEQSSIPLEREISIEHTSIGASITYQSLSNQKRFNKLKEVSADGELLLIMDEADQFQKKAVSICNELLALHPKNQCLFISRTPIIGLELEETYKFGQEYLFEPSLIYQPNTRIQIAHYSPSLYLLDEIKLRRLTLDDLGWREFEILVSQLLESDGYEIELMRGTKDGGVDVVAYKDLGEAGMFKTLWQAKKNKLSRKVGIATIRELADVRIEHSASKALIVTTSTLTSGALLRINRDKHILGKVDRGELETWINRKLFQ